MRSFEQFIIEAEPTTPADPMANPPIDPNAMPMSDPMMGGMPPIGGGMPPDDFPPMGGGAPGGMEPSEPLKPIKVPLTVWEVLEKLLDGDKV